MAFLLDLENSAAFRIGLFHRVKLFYLVSLAVCLLCFSRTRGEMNIVILQGVK